MLWFLISLPVTVPLAYEVIAEWRFRRWLKRMRSRSPSAALKAFSDFCAKTT